MEDCLQEARLQVWKLYNRLQAVPLAEWEPYITVCVRRTVWRVLRRELQHRSGATWVKEMEWQERVFVGSGCATERWEPLIMDQLLDRIDRPDLAAALEALPPDDYAILNLCYFEGLRLEQIALRLSVSVDAAIKRRQRALARLRKALASGET